MLMPRRTKYRKQMRGKMRGAATRGNSVVFGEFGLQAQTSGWIDSRQIESARRAITGTLRRGGKVWIRIFPDLSYTKKPAEVRMGKGKGSPEGWCAPVQAGRMLFEMEGVTRELAMEALRLAAHKLPCNTQFIERGVVHAS